MQNIYGKGVTTACGLSDDEADDYENVTDNRKAPALPERLKEGNKTKGKKEDLQLKHMDKPSHSGNVHRAGNTTVSGPRTVPPFQPPPIGLDFSSAAVNAAFREQTVEQTSEKKRKWDWKKMVLIFCLVLLFLFWILLAGIMFIYYSRISHQLTELKTNVSQIQDLSKKERETWKEDLLKVNLTLVKEIAILRSDVQSIQRVSVNEIAVLKSDVQSIKKVLGSLGLCTSCPAGWTLIDSSCYFFSTSHQSWENSERECSNMASSLLILNSQKNLDALLPFIGNKRFWIGLKKYNRETWRWVDGTIPKYTKPIETGIFHWVVPSASYVTAGVTGAKTSNWFRGEPNNMAQREHCTEMISGGWNDLDCSNKIDYICKKTTSC